MVCDERTVLAFLSEELDDADRLVFDGHLLECERCWSAVTEDRRGRTLAEALREPAPAGLADRIRLGAEARRSPAGRRAGGDGRLAARRWLGAGVGAVAAAAVAVVAVAPWSSAPTTPATPATSMAATFAVVHLGKALPAHVAGPPMSSPRMMGSPVSMSMDGIELDVAYYRVDDGEALVAHSALPFAIPAGGVRSPDGRAWTAQLDGMVIYCSCAAGTPAMAIVTPMQSGAASELAAYLAMPT